MTINALSTGEAYLYNIFIPICTYQSDAIQSFMGYIYLHKISFGDIIHIKLSVNGKVHLYTEYKDQQLMTVVHIAPVPLFKDDILKIEVRNISQINVMTTLSYKFYLSK